MARPKSKGAYTPLAAQYYLDDAILEAGPDAELLFIRCLAFLASVASDGFITERQVKIVAGAGLRNVPKRLATLQQVGLFEAVEGGFVARSWLKWNKSAQEMDKLLAKDRERKARKDAEDVHNSERNPNEFRADSEDQYRAEQSSTEQNNTSSSEVAVAPIRQDVLTLIERLDQRITENGGKVPSRTKKNLDAARLLLDRDGITFEQAMTAIDWATNDEFWRSNILSMSKLRDKYEQLRLAATRSRKPQTAPVAKADQNAALYYELYGGGNERTGSVPAIDAG